MFIIASLCSVVCYFSLINSQPICLEGSFCLLDADCVPGTLCYHPIITNVFYLPARLQTYYAIHFRKIAMVLLSINKFTHSPTLLYSFIENAECCTGYCDKNLPNNFQRMPLKPPDCIYPSQFVSIKQDVRIRKLSITSATYHGITVVN
jgi:hypothetical protein